MGTAKTAVEFSLLRLGVVMQMSSGCRHDEDSGGILAAGRIEHSCILVPPPIPAIVLANTVLAWSNGPAQSVVGAVCGGKWRGQEEVVMVHTWASVVVELAWLSSSSLSSCRKAALLAKP